MVRDTRATQGGLMKQMALDPKTDKQVFKEKITRTILEQIEGTFPAEVYQLVDEGYERLLKDATITTHIPVLVEGLVRAQERKKYRDH